jgi:hypothetical protein
MPLPPMPLKNTGESIIRAALLGAARIGQPPAKWKIGGSKRGFFYFLHFVTFSVQGQVA